MRVIGLTGGIASGKSAVSELLGERGATVIDADKIGHEAYRKGTVTFNAVVDAFGQDVVGQDGEIDRRTLGRKVFANPEARRRLELIVWPAMRLIMEQRLDQLRTAGASVAVLEAALLIEADWLPLVDEVWLVAASPDVARKRLMERNGLTAEEAESRLRAQLPNEKRREYASTVIENDGSLPDLRSAVERAWASVKAA
jgi:dephospho-CoA kinase